RFRLRPDRAEQARPLRPERRKLQVGLRPDATSISTSRACVRLHRRGRSGLKAAAVPIRRSRLRPQAPPAGSPPTRHESTITYQTDGCPFYGYGIVHVSTRMFGTVLGPCHVGFARPSESVNTSHSRSPIPLPELMMLNERPPQLLPRDFLSC